MNLDVQQPATLNTANVVAGLIRFLHAVRVRRGTLLAALLISAVLGAAYYATATRLFDAHAQVRIVQSERSHNTLTSEQQSSQANADVFQMMATYQRIMSGDRVLSAALEDLPKEYCVDRCPGCRAPAAPACVVHPVPSLRGARFHRPRAVEGSRHDGVWLYGGNCPRCHALACA